MQPFRPGSASMPTGARSQAAAADPDAPLHGFTFGVKDLFDVEGLPTTWGTPIYAGNLAVKDSACVALARAAGAIIMGKTVTTEFAYHRSAAARETRGIWNARRAARRAAPRLRSRMATCAPRSVRKPWISAMVRLRTGGRGRPPAGCGRYGIQCKSPGCAARPHGRGRWP